MKSLVRICTSVRFDELKSLRVTLVSILSYFKRDCYSGTGLSSLVQMDFASSDMIEEAGTHLEKNKSSSRHWQPEHGVPRGNSCPSRATGRALHRLRCRHH